MFVHILLTHYLQCLSPIPLPYRYRGLANTWTARFIQLTRMMTAQGFFRVLNPYGSPGTRQPELANHRENQHMDAYYVIPSSIYFIYENRVSLLLDSAWIE